MAATPPPPHRRQRRRRFSTAVIVASAAAVWVWGFCVYAGHDRLEFIDRDATVAVARRSCPALRTRLERIERGRSEGRERTEAENGAVTGMVADFRALGADALSSDHPVESWLEDWQLLTQARIDHIDRYGLEKPVPFVLPLDEDGESIVIRMNDLARDSGLPECTVPTSLMHPSAN